MKIYLPETADELLVSDVAIAIDIVEFHQCLQFYLLGEDSIKGASSKLQFKVSSITRMMFGRQIISVTN